MQGDGAVAVPRKGRCQCLNIVARGGIGSVVPSVAVAPSCRVFAGSAMSDGQVESHHAVASVGIGFGDGGCVVVCGVGVSINPCIGVAGGLYIGFRATIVDCEVECDDAVAASCICLCESGCVVGSNVSRSVPSVGVAGGLHIGAGVAVVGGEVECYQAVAVGGIDERVLCCVVVGGICLSVNPGVSVASCLYIDACVAVVNDQIECYDAVTVGDIGLNECVCVVGCGIGGSVPGVAVAGCDVFNAGVAVVDGEDQGIVSDSIDATLSISRSIPQVGVTGGDGCGRTVIDGEVQSGDRVTASHVGAGECRCGGAFYILSTVPYITVAGSYILGACVAIVDCQIEVDYTITAGRVGLSKGVCVVGRGVGGSVPSVGVAGCGVFRISVAIVDGKVECYHAVAVVGVG